VLTGSQNWRNPSGDEVDLLIEANARLYPVECKRPDGYATRGIQPLRQLGALVC